MFLLGVLWARPVIFLFVAVTCLLDGVDSWLLPQKAALQAQQRWTTIITTSRTKSCLTLSSESSGSSESNNQGEIPDIRGKDIYQRVFYRLSPFSGVEVHNAIVVEERVRFEPDEAKGEGYLKPVGPRTLILRDGQVDEGEIGEEIFEINVRESMAEGATHAGAGRDRAMEATIATMLYLAANPKYIVGSVLEVGCGLGLASLLGSIGAGTLKVHSGKGEEVKSEKPPTDEAAGDDILTIPKGTPLSDELKMLTLSDEEAENLKLALANIQHSNVPSSKVSVEELSWRTRSLRRSAPKVYHTIIASDLNYNFPEAKALAHTVAHRLEALSSWDLMKGDSKSPPTFLHVCPDAREDISYFKRFLSKGYRMNLKTGYLKLEKLIFRFQLLPKSEPEEKLDDLELEVQEVKESVFQSLTAEHHPDYAEGAGEYFFPMETGEYDSASGATYLEPETGGNKWS